MRSIVFIIYMLCLSGISHLNAQVEIILSQDSACDSLMFNARLSPDAAYDTISSLTWTIEETGMTSKGDTASFLVETPGDYTLEVNVNNAFSLEYPSKLNVLTSPGSEFIFSDTVIAGDYTYEFRPEISSGEQMNFTYEWYVGEKFIANTPELSYNFTETGRYPVRLTVRNDDGCSSSSSRMVVISELLQCPNVFTPNMDGYNDFFSVKTDGTTLYSFQVFSRTGIKVYQTESPYISWDGRSLSGVEMQPGIYYYLIETLNGEENDKVSGFVHLIR